jgi:antitoxin component of RelBE/YafQ-DinJ toxin-antitoxin module
MTTYINSNLRALVREKKIPFELTTKQQSNAEYLTNLDESIAQAERGEIVKYTMEELKSLVAGE